MSASMGDAIASTSDAFKALVQAKNVGAQDVDGDKEKVAAMYLARNFLQFSKEEFFLKDVTSAHLKTCLERSDVTGSEEQLLQILLKWLKNDWENRKKDAPELLKLIRFGLIPMEKVSELLDDDIRALRGWSMNVKIIEHLHKRNEEEGSMTHKSPGMFAPRSMTTLMAIGDIECHFISMHYWDPKEKYWTEVEKYYFPRVPIPSLRDHRMISVEVHGEDQIFLVGGSLMGELWSKGIMRYDIGARKWRALRPMNNERCRTAVVHLDGSIYVIGGVNCFDEELFLDEDDSDAVDDEDSGEDADDDDGDSDDRDDNNDIDSDNADDNNFGSIGINDDNDVITDSNIEDDNVDESKGSVVERYHIASRQWEAVAHLPKFSSLTIHRHMSVVVKCGKIVLGSYDTSLHLANESDESNLFSGASSYTSIHMYDPKTNKWHLLIKEQLPDLHDERPYGIFLDDNGTCLRVYTEKSGKDSYVNEIELHLADDTNPTATIGKSHSQEGIPTDIKAFTVCRINTDIYVYRNGTSYKLLSDVDSEIKLQEAKEVLERLDDMEEGLEVVCCTFDLAKILNSDEDCDSDDGDASPVEYDYDREDEDEDDDAHVDGGDCSIM